MLAATEMEAAQQLLAAAQSVAVVGHLRPDADAIGSVCATVSACRQLGKTAQGFIGQQNPLGENLLTIPGAGEVSLVETIPEVDLIITVDCGSVERLGSIAPQFLAKDHGTIVIDHHATNSGFGAVNLVDTAAESATTVLVEFFDYLDIELDQAMAHALYAGLLTDTGGFRWGRPQMYNLAYRLVSTYHLNIQKISSDLIDSTTISSLGLIGEILSDVRSVQAGHHRLAVLVADFETIKNHSESTIESLIDLVRSVIGTDVGVVLKEYHPGEFTVSLRSATVDVGAIADALGGGGHIAAAGYVSSGSAEHVLAELTGAVSKVD